MMLSLCLHKVMVVIASGMELPIAKTVSPKNVLFKLSRIPIHSIRSIIVVTRRYVHINPPVSPRMFINR